MTTPDPIHPASGDLEAVVDSDQRLRHVPDERIGVKTETPPQTFDAVLASLALRPANPPATAAGVGEAVALAIYRTARGDRSGQAIHDDVNGRAIEEAELRLQPTRQP
jgi:hypothetical protein